jgi:hypothetical protein
MKLHSNTWAVCLCLLLGSGLLFASPPVVYAATNFTIGWDPNSEADLDGYGIHVSEGTPGPPYVHVEDVFLDALSDPDNPQIILTGFEDGTYYIAATAFDIHGNESEYSEELGVRVSGSDVTPISTIDGGGGGGGGG